MMRAHKKRLYVMSQTSTRIYNECVSIMCTANAYLRPTRVVQGWYDKVEMKMKSFNKISFL